MDKKTPANPPAAQPSLFDQAGDMLAHLGDRIADAKDTVVGIVTEEVVVVKKAARKVAKKVKKAVRKVAKKAPAKKAAKKKAAKKAIQGKKPVKKAVRKIAKKVVVKKRKG